MCVCVCVGQRGSLDGDDDDDDDDDDGGGGGGDGGDDVDGDASRAVDGNWSRDEQKTQLKSSTQLKSHAASVLRVVCAGSGFVRGRERVHSPDPTLCAYQRPELFTAGSHEGAGVLSAPTATTSPAGSNFRFVLCLSAVKLVSCVFDMLENK